MLISVQSLQKKHLHFINFKHMKAQIVTNNELSLEYYTQGIGRHTLVCFHGHGRGVEDFNFLRSNNRRLILIVLPHHGKSQFFPLYT